jgi:hypothetical protein
MVVRQDDQQYAIGYTGGINGNMLYKYDSGYLEAYSIDSGGNLTRQANSDVHSYRTHPFSFKIAYNEFCGTQPKTVQMDSYGITMADGKPDKTLVALMGAAQGTACSTEPRDYLFMNQPGIVSFNNPGPDAGVTPIPGVTPGTGLLGAHMPYMRWWDTGASAGNSWHGGHFENTLGSWDTNATTTMQPARHTGLESPAFAIAGSLIGYDRPTRLKWVVFSDGWGLKWSKC